MSKAEFLDILREQLDGEIPSGEIYSNIRYYEQYIEREIQSGKTEEEVMDMLGDPRLIAKTLIDADEVSPQGSFYEDVSYTQEDAQDSGTERTYYNEDFSNSDPTPHVHGLDLTTWYGKLLLVLGAGALIFLLITVLSFLLPFIIVIVLICVVLSLIKRRN